jgi:hypothetical protein
LRAGLSLLDDLLAEDHPPSDRLMRIGSLRTDVWADYGRIQSSQSGRDAEMAARAFDRTASSLVAQLSELEADALAILAATVRSPDGQRLDDGAHRTIASNHLGDLFGDLRFDGDGKE